jgi:predicted RNA-binding Zn-ribbon protein involved in translation (DUF1610 family)
MGGQIMNKTKKCPNCDYEGIMECWEPVTTTGLNYKCPNCKFTFGNKKTGIKL